MEETTETHVFIDVQVCGSSQPFGVSWLDLGKWWVGKNETHHVIAEHEHFPKSAPVWLTP
jgi:hypothetical protein